MQRQDTKWVIELLTNVRFTVFKTKFLLGNSDAAAPQYIKNNRAIYSLVSDKRTGKMYRDNLCAFRCLALHQWHDLKNLEAACRKNFERWELTQESKSPFQGIMLQTDMPRFEQCFEVNVEVFSLDEDGIAQVVYTSMGKYETTMFLNLSGQHLSYIHNFQLYTKQYRCKFCLKIWNSASLCKRHALTCEKKEKFLYPGGFLSAPKYMFDRLREAGISCGEEDFYPWFIVYDFEAIQPPVESTGDVKLHYERQHIPVSVSVCSNVPNFTEPKCYVNLDPDQLIKDMIGYMTEIRSAACFLARERWVNEFNAIKMELERLKKKQRDDKTTYEEHTATLKGDVVNFAEFTKEDQARKSELNGLLDSFKRYMAQIPVLGFCSSRYDINLVKEKLLLHLEIDQSDEGFDFVIKKCNSYLCISTGRFRFLDMAQYLAPNTSYASFLEAFEVQEQKGFFPYEWFDDYSKLDHPALPGREEFYNSFKNEELAQIDYDKCLTVWREQHMTSFREFLIWYNNLDVGPFVKAVEKWQQLYFKDRLDVFKTAISLPGIARQKLYDIAMRNGAQFALVDKSNADLHHLLTRNLFGGPSVIFHRHAEKGVTKIRGGKVVQKVIGFDCNALYLYCLSARLPTNIFVRRKAETGFKPDVRDHYIKAYAWMQYLNDQGTGFVRHARNVGYEKRIGRYPVDGWDQDNNIVYQFHGCYFHGHECDLTKNVKDPNWHDTRQERYQRTKDITEYISERVSNVVELWECEFKELCRLHPYLYRFIDEQRPDFHRKHKGCVTEEQILGGVRSGELFGFVECDLRVPERWGKGFENFSKLTPYQYFEEMSPIFCTSEVPYEAFGQHMQEYVEKMGMGKKPRVLLVGGMSAQDILIATPLLRWYLEHGIEVTKIHQVVEFQQMKCFDGLSRSITEARRAADVDEKLKVIAEANKVRGNASYGCLCLDRCRHCDVAYMKGTTNVSQAVNEPTFKKLTCLSEEEEFYELQFSKTKIKLDIPIQIAIFVVNLAKLRMLEFHYDLVDRLVDRSDYMLLETDTDSLYMALSTSSFEEAVRPHLKEEYLKKVNGQCKDGPTQSLEFFPRSCCHKHALYDKREPGVFKTEFEGDEMIGLCSKTYFAENRELEKTKLSCNGVNRNLVQNPKEVFKKVLKNKQPETCEKRGIRAKGNTMYTYKQSKIGFNYFYVKRKVLADGVSTVPLDLVLKPAKRPRVGQAMDHLDEDVEV